MLSRLILVLTMPSLVAILTASAVAEEFDLRNTQLGQEANQNLQEIKEKHGQGNNRSAGWNSLVLDTKGGIASGEAYLRNRHVTGKLLGREVIPYDFTLHGRFRADVNQGNTDVEVDFGRGIRVKLNNVTNVRGEIMKSLNDFGRREAVKLVDGKSFALRMGEGDSALPLQIEAVEPEKRLHAAIDAFQIRDNVLTAKASLRGPCHVRLKLPLGDTTADITLACDIAVQIKAKGTVTSKQGKVSIDPKIGDLEFNLEVTGTKPDISDERRAKLTKGLDDALKKNIGKLIDHLNNNLNAFVLQ